MNKLIYYTVDFALFGATYYAAYLLCNALTMTTFTVLLLGGITMITYTLLSEFIPRGW